MATHTTQSPSRSANPITFAAAEAGGDGWANNGQDLLIVRHTNDMGSPVTLTVTTTITVDDQDVADRQIEIGPGETHVLGPFSKAYYNDAEGHVALGWGDHTDIELAVIRP